MTDLTPIVTSYGDEQLARVDAIASKQYPTLGVRQARAAYVHRLVLDHTPKLPTAPPPPPPGPVSPHPVFTELAWSDEFVDTGLDDSKWIALDGVHAWDSAGLELYRAGQVTADRAGLLLTAVKGANGAVSSGAISTRGQYAPDGKDRHVLTPECYVEARIACPDATWTWPAFWLVGAAGTPGWPAYGEIDVMEQYGPHPEYYEATFHWRSPTGNKQEGGVKIPYPAGDARGFHTYGVEWRTSGLAFYLDGKVVQTFTPDDNGARAALTYPHTLILNLAVGGDNLRNYGHGWDGTVPVNTPVAMEVDYVREWRPTVA